MGNALGSIWALYGLYMGRIKTRTGSAPRAPEQSKECSKRPLARWDEAPPTKGRRSRGAPASAMVGLGQARRARRRSRPGPTRDLPATRPRPARRGPFPPRPRPDGAARPDEAEIPRRETRRGANGARLESPGGNRAPGKGHARGAPRPQQISRASQRVSGGVARSAFNRGFWKRTCVFHLNGAAAEAMSRRRGSFTTWSLPPPSR